MAKQKNEHRIGDHSRDAQGRPQVAGAPGTVPGRAGTAGTEGENVGNPDAARRGPAEEGTGIQGWAAQQSESAPAAPDTRDAAKTNYQDLVDQEREAAEDSRSGGVRRATDETQGGDAERVGRGGRTEERSGTLPGSVGGVTGTSGHNAGIQSPGATEPTFPGQSLEEAEQLRKDAARKRARGES